MTKMAMTGIPSGFSTAATSGQGARGQVLATAAQARDRLDTLTRQASTGRIADGLAGLGTGAAASLALRAEKARLEAWQANIDTAAGRMDVARAALARIGAIAADFRARTAELNGLSAGMVDSVAARARDALGEVASLLNESHGGIHVFAGQDGTNPPIPAAASILSSGFATAISAAVADLATNGAAATIAATLAIASSNAPGTSPFSAALSQSAAAVNALATTVPIGEGERIGTGIQASANAEAASTGATTTGSYMRDILRGLATLGALDGAQAGTADFAALVEDVRAGLEGAVTALSVDAGVLGDRQAALQARRDRLDAVATVLSKGISAAEDVDMAATLSALSLAQTQLQASYQLLAGLPALSLVRFLPSG